MAGGEEIRGGGKIGAKVAATRLGDGWTQTAGLVTAPELTRPPRRMRRLGGSQEMGWNPFCSDPTMVK